MKNIVVLLVVSLFTFTSFHTTAASLELLWEAKGFKEPESMLFDQQRKVIYVSNVAGKPNEKNGKGSIALLSTDGKKADQQWVTGLNAPKGLALVDKILYVADIDTLVAIDVTTQKIVQRYVIEKAKFLNDVAADKQGNIYVSDFLDNSIYRLSDGKFTLWLADKKLETPNGLLVEEDTLLVGSWGVITDGFATKVAGHIKRIDIKSKKINSLGNGKPLGNLDGLEANSQGGYFATDWMAGSILSIKPNGESSVLLDTEVGTADLGIMNDALLIPIMKQNVARAYKIIK